MDIELNLLSIAYVGHVERSQVRAVLTVKGKWGSSELTETLWSTILNEWVAGFLKCAIRVIRFKLFLPWQCFCFVFNQSAKAASNCLSEPLGKVLARGPGGALTSRKTMPNEGLPPPLQWLLSPLKNTENSSADLKLHVYRKKVENIIPIAWG